MIHAVPPVAAVAHVIWPGTITRVSEAHERERQAATGHEAPSGIEAPLAVAPALAPTTPSGVLALQRSAGNKAVAGMLDQAALQRAPARTSQAANIAKLNTLRANADARFGLTSDIAVKARDTGDLTRAKLSAVGDVYRQGFTQFRNVLNAAEKEAQNQQDWVNISVGLACGIGAGLVAAWALPATASVAWAISAQEAIVVAASSAGQGVAGAVVSTGVAGVLPTVAGRQIDSSGVDPMIQELAMWQKAAEIYRSGLEFADLGRRMHGLTVALSDLLADVRVYDSGGESRLTDEDIAGKITALEARDAEMAPMNDQLTAKVAELDRIAEAVRAIDPAARNARQMERDIWNLWMATLPLNSNILDIDAIEDHIGPNGLGIIDFGVYTSDGDENEAIENARNTSRMLRAEQRQAVGDETRDPENRGEQLRILTR